MPEPSPLFWPQFSARVRTAVRREAPPASTGPSWLRWQVLLPLGAAAMIILGLMFAVPDRDHAERASAEPAVDANTARDPAAPSDSWVVLAELIGEMDLDTATAAGLVAPGVAEQAVWRLTADEQQEMTRLLRQN